MNKVLAIKGRGKGDDNLSPKLPEIPAAPTLVTKTGEAKPMNPKVYLYNLGVHKLREKSLERLATEDGPGECYFANGISEKQLKEFFAERLIDGKWVRNGRNESLDLFGYAEAARQILRPENPRIDWSSPPPWARPVPLSRKGGDHAVEANRQAEKPADNQMTLLERFARLNEGN